MAHPGLPMPDVPAPTQEDSNSRRVLRGFVAMTASSFAVMAVQLGYAAITSRLLPPSAFGAYAVALSGVGFIGMLSGSSLGLAAARRDHESVQLDRSLLTLALIWGCATGLAAILLAPFWGRIWGVPESTRVTQILALGIPLSALSAVLAGILRRGGRTSAVAGRTALGQLAGMAVGLSTILSLKTPWSLGVASVAALMVTTVLMSACLPHDRLKPARPTSNSINDSLYAVKFAGMNLIRQGAVTFPLWSVGKFVGADALGAVNRATTLVTLPLETATRGLSYSLFPEMRPGGPASRSPTALTDLMILVTWAAVILGGTGYFLAAPVVLLVLGSQWTAIAPLAGWAVLLGLIPAIGTPLGSTLEALGHFKLTLWGFVAYVPAALAGAVVTWAFDTPVPALVGLVVGTALQATAFIVVAGRLGILEISDYLTGVRGVFLTQAAFAIILGGVSMSGVDGTQRILWLCGIVLSEFTLLWIFRHRTQFGRVAAIYSLPGFRRRSSRPRVPLRRRRGISR